MPQFSNSKSFYLITLLSAAVIFTAAVSFNRAYEARVLVLLIPKDEKAAQSLEFITENAKVFGALNSEIKTRRIEKSSLVILTAQEANSSQAKIKVLGAAQSLSQTMSHYYNIKTELEIRIVGQPTFKRVLKYNLFYLIFLSLILGLIVSLLSFYISKLILGFAARPVEKKVDFFSLANLPQKTDEPKEVVEVSKIQTTPEVKTEAKAEKQKTISPSKKAAAPDNLPVADESTLKEINKKLYTEKDNNLIQDPGPEEIKERLNKLLSGEWKM